MSRINRIQRLGRLWLLIAQWHFLQCSCTMLDVIFFFLKIADRTTYHARRVLVFLLFHVIASEIFLYDDWIKEGIMISFMEIWGTFVLVVYIDSMSQSHILQVHLITVLSFFINCSAGFYCQQSKNRDHSYIKSRIWDMIENWHISTISTRVWASRFFIRTLFGEVSHPNLQGFVWLVPSRLSLLVFGVED